MKKYMCFRTKSSSLYSSICQNSRPKCDDCCFVVSVSNRSWLQCIFNFWRKTFYYLNLSNSAQQFVLWTINYGASRSWGLWYYNIKYQVHNMITSLWRLRAQSKKSSTQFSNRSMINSFSAVIRSVLSFFLGKANPVRAASKSSPPKFQRSFSSSTCWPKLFQDFT